MINAISDPCVIWTSQIYHSEAMTDRRNAPEAVLREVLELIEEGGLTGPARGWVVKRIREVLKNQPGSFGDPDFD
jgi:hypothetical protein